MPRQQAENTDAKGLTQLIEPTRIDAPLAREVKDVRLLRHRPREKTSYRPDYLAQLHSLGDQHPPLLVELFIKINHPGGSGVGIKTAEIGQSEAGLFGRLCPVVAKDFHAVSRAKYALYLPIDSASPCAIVRDTMVSEKLHVPKAPG
jgi:hypothetical protein